METTETFVEPVAAPPRKPWWSVWIPVFLLSLAVWATFGRTAANEFSFDDLKTIKNNETIASLRNLPILWSKQDYFRLSDEYTYRPVVTFSYFLDHAIAGKRPWFYHVHNIVLHQANVLLAFALFSMLGAGRWRSFVIALIFAIHPLQCEAVIFPSFREDLQVTTGMLAMGCCLAADRNRPAAGWIFGAGLALAFGLFAKEAALLLPLAWLAFDCLYGLRTRLQVALPRRYVFLLLVLAGYVAVRFVLMANPGARDLDVIEYLPLQQRIATAPHLFAYYLERLFWPAPLCIIHEVEPLGGLGPPFFWSLGLCAAFALLWIVLSWREPWLWLAGLWVGVTFAPVSNLYPIISLWAERFYYSVTLGTAAIVVAAGGALWALFVGRVRERRWVAWAIGGWCAIAFVAWVAALYGLRRTIDCRSSLSLWRQTVRCVPENGVALKTLAKYELDAGNFTRARNLALHAEKREGGGVYAANYILGQIALRQKRWHEAIAHFRKALTVPPPALEHQTTMVVNLATAYLRIDRRDQAAAFLREALKRDPNSRAARAAQKLLQKIEGNDAATTPPTETKNQM